MSSIVALLIGKAHSQGLPKKNILPLLGRPLCEYPLMAASESKYIHKIYISTDSPEIVQVACNYNAFIIERPEHILDPDTLTEDVLAHAWDTIRTKYNDNPDVVCLLYANAPFVSGSMIDSAVERLMRNSDFDSCVGVCRADMFTPVRAVKIDVQGGLQPVIDSGVFDDVTSQRDTVGGVYFIDLSLQILRASCFEDMDDGVLPFKWLGKRRIGFEKDFGFDLDARWQIPVIRQWMYEQGITPKINEVYHLH